MNADFVYCKLTRPLIGNSGGALVNADGQVIGINSAKIALEGVEGIGLAIPINTVRPIVESLIAKGRVVRAYLGIGIVDKNIATKQGYQVNFDSGVLIVKVAPNAPAGKAGLQEGDIILNIGNLPTNNVAQLREALDSQNVGSVVNVEINRQGKNCSSYIRGDASRINENNNISSRQD